MATQEEYEKMIFNRAIAKIREFSNALEAPVLLPEIEVLPEPVDVIHPISEIESPADSRPEFRY